MRITVLVSLNYRSQGSVLQITTILSEVSFIEPYFCLGVPTLKEGTDHRVRVSVFYVVLLGLWYTQSHVSGGDLEMNISKLSKITVQEKIMVTK